VKKSPENTMARQLMRWNEGSILENIQRLNDSNADLRDSNVQTEYRKLYRAACWHLGSWRNALKRAGVSYEKVQERVYAEKDRKQKADILLKLKTAHDSGVKLDRGSILKNPDYSVLYWSAKKFYSGRTFWEDVLEEAGLDPLEIVVQKRWTKQKIKEAILERKAKGLALNLGLISREDSALAHAIDNHFESHEEALRYSGVNPQEVVMHHASYTAQELIETIISYHIKGIDLSPRKAKSKRKNNSKLRGVYFAACKKFNGWANALSTAGIEPEKYVTRISLDTEEVKTQIRKLYETGVSLNSSIVSKTNIRLYKAGIRRFGSWEAAITSSGLDYSQISLQRESLSSEDLIAGIKRIAEEGQSLDCTSVSESENVYVRRLFHQSCSRFNGGWAEAIEKAGFDYDAIRLKRKKYTFKELATIVRDWETQGKDLEALAVMSDPLSSKIHHAVSRRFSTWYDFLDKAGIDSSKYRRMKDWKEGEGVLEALKEMFPSGIVTSIRGKDNNLAAAVCKYFGSVRVAAEKAGLVYKRGGKIRRKFLNEKPETIGRLYKMNEEFIRGIVDKVYYGAMGRGIPSVDADDLMQEAFFIFMREITKKPAEADLRDFIYKPIYEGLIHINRAHAKRARKEQLWGEEVYFDVIDSVDQF
jgi:hypothetical protein